MDQGCLDERTVVEFVEGALPDDRRQIVEGHLAGCASCADLITFTAAELRDETRPLAGVHPPLGGALAPGTRVGRYQILERVGRGGMGEVYAAYHPDLDRKIAIKVVHESGTGTAERQARLLREARSIARLQHPNVVTVYDAGAVGDRVYVAMEFVDGLTIDRWLEAAPRSSREILRAFIAAGRGLAAAHAAGLVHRDFKPQNVMITRDGAVRVMDFGLVRSADGEPPSIVDVAETPETAPASPLLTRAGTIVGTPAYMAPEQFRGDVADARSDQFSFCVALYEALHGERPFQGENVLSLSMNVTEGEFRPTSSSSNDVPLWIRRPLLRGLRVDPNRRHPSMDALIAALEADPAIKRRQRLLTAASIAVVLASVLTARHVASSRRQELEGRIAAFLATSAERARGAEQRREKATAVRQRAFAAFDAMDGANGEAMWREALALGRAADDAYEQAEQPQDAALVLDGSRTEVRSGLNRLLRAHLALAEGFHLGDRARVLASRLAALGSGATLQSQADASLTLRVTPSDAVVVLERYDIQPVTQRRLAAPVAWISGPEPTSLRPGSYRIRAEAAGRANLTYPFTLEPGERKVLDLAPPLQSAIPAGFVYVPGGEFWYGDSDEQLRTQFLNAVPVHRRASRPFAIAVHETTYGEWIEFLSSLPPAERRRHAPSITATMRGSLDLREVSGSWQLTFQQTSHRYVVRQGQPFVYVGRARRAQQDWSRFPVGGITSESIRQYLEWLARSGRVKGARLCTDVEWERAARGADDRLFPNGDLLGPDDANFDLTYDRTDGAYGPDEVGSHPSSRSPFGVDDLVGNVFELVTSSNRPNELAIRGGAYYFDAITARSTNRGPVPTTFSDIATGLRVCADAE